MIRAIKNAGYCVLLLTAIFSMSCDDGTQAPTGLPVQELVIYRHGLEDEVRLAWQPASGCSGYRVLRAFDSRGPFTLMAQVSDTNWSDWDFPAGSAVDSLVFYRVAGVRYDGQLTPMSNTVGYYHFLAGGEEHLQGFHTPFGLPFVFWRHDNMGIPIYGRESHRASDILGDQATPGGPVDADKIVQQGGSQAYRDGTGSEIFWTDPLEDRAELIPGKAYWYVNKTGHPIDIYLMGEVNDSGHYGELLIHAPGTTYNYSNPYAWRITHPIRVEALGLIEQGFVGGTATESDQIVAQDGSGEFAVFLEETGEWYPEGFRVLPGRAYWIMNRHVDHPWTYEYRP